MYIGAEGRSMLRAWIGRRKGGRGCAKPVQTITYIKRRAERARYAAETRLAEIVKGKVRYVALFWG